MASRFRGAPNARAMLSMTGAGSRPPITAGRPGRKMPAFSRAIASIVLPRYSWWSSPMLVTTATVGSTTLTASSRPPMPISSTQASRFAASKINRAASALNSKKVSATEPRAASIFSKAATNSSVWEAVMNADALAVVAQVRRREGTDFEARGAQDGGAIGAHRALAIGAGDGDHRDLRLPPPQPLEYDP